MGELMGHTRVNLGIILAKVAKWPWGPPKGLGPGGECFAPLAEHPKSQVHARCPLAVWCIPGLSLLSWGGPAPSPGCSMHSLGFPCCLCAKIMKSFSAVEPVHVLRAEHVIITDIPLIQNESLISKVGPTRFLWRSDTWIASTSSWNFLREAVGALRVTLRAWAS